MSRYSACVDLSLARTRAAWLCALAVVCGTASMTSTAKASLPNVPVPTENPITEQKRILGKILFWDEQLSTSGTMSCGTCHTPGRAGAEGRIATNPGPDPNSTADDNAGSLGIVRSDEANDYIREAIFGVNVQVTGRAAGSFFMAAWAPEAFWDGRARGQFVDPQTGQVAIVSGGALESQSMHPPLSTAEMSTTGNDWNQITARLVNAKPLHFATGLPSDVAAVLASKPTYPQLFAAAFGDGAITSKRIAFALATYQRTLVPDQAPIDKYELGIPGAMTNSQVQGLGAFGAAGPSCAACHTGRLLTDHSYRALGVRPPSEDLGRQNVTGDTNDRGKFRTPSLRNVGLKRRFMHNGKFTTITEVVSFYNRTNGAPASFADNRDPLMPGISIASSNVNPIIDYLTNALTDPRVAAQTFPFDKPTLYSERAAASKISFVPGGIATSGNYIPSIIVDSVPFVGNNAFRVGLDSISQLKTARLGVSTSPPVGGVITPTRFVFTRTTEGAGSKSGMVTAKLYLNPRLYQDGVTYYFQWFIDDPAAPNGLTASNIAKVPVFCGSYGCFAPCSPSDIGDDAGNPLPSNSSNTGVNEGDYNTFFSASGFFEQSSMGPDAIGASCDIADDQGNPLPPFSTAPGVNNGVNEGDYNCFFNAFFIPCAG